MLQEIYEYDIDILRELSNEDWDAPQRLCIQCGEPLPEDWEESLCEECMDLGEFYER